MSGVFRYLSPLYIVEYLSHLNPVLSEATTLVCPDCPQSLPPSAGVTGALPPLPGTCVGDREPSSVLTPSWQASSSPSLQLQDFICLKETR